MTVALELRNVLRRFGSVVAVNNVSLTVGKGEFVTLLGPSGSGKTSTLRLIGGFEELDGGAILLNHTNTPLGDFLTPTDYAQFVSDKYTTGAAGDTVRLDGAAFALTPFAVTHETDHQTEHLLLVHPVSALA